MQSESVMVEPATKPLSRWQSMKIRAALLAGSGMGLVGLAAAEVNFTTISELIQAVTTLIPDFLDLVIAYAPLIVTVSVIAFVIKFLDRILSWMNM